MKNSTSMLHRIKPRLAVASSGLAAGLISSLAISGLILLAEKVAQLPVGTFYLVLASAVLQNQSHSVDAIALGLLLHLVAGSIIGLVISAPFCASARLFASASRYGPAYGLVAGFLLWLVLFLPITFGLILPLLNMVDGQVIRQQAPTGQESVIATTELLSIIDKVIAGSLAFNVFFGLLVMIIMVALSRTFMRSNQVII